MLALLAIWSRRFLMERLWNLASSSGLTDSFFILSISSSMADWHSADVLPAAATAKKIKRFGYLSPGKPLEAEAEMAIFLSFTSDENSLEDRPWPRILANPSR